ncbi:MULTISPECIES: hypothetical protein [unclassified Bosea (in: a-proteobacteria)]|uniref:hypothetical protein n=1 Tax=unclassified Bosea (in: a-proteobacteria) TaxID=2653178 RepID=UPI000F75B087|nr:MULTISPECIES: hypothetical protein [unclassified Bosea (in: a-proteobacteria)]AZO77713.1 hypothetical protein BLM15_08860 [Bosea sp. Tri-49]RXT18326.1 hypothetical protein B5U98_24015 [Bosea sp. Tri-39]RXT32922.1 hypothetical protein B5U99_30360 [Bosea sp. Tri-54]
MSAPRREDQPDGSVKITFASPILDVDQPKTHLMLRPPSVAEFWEIGDPRHFVYSADGLGTPFTDRPTLAVWIKRLITGHDVDLIGMERDLALAMVIEGAVLDFFMNARMSLNRASAPSPNAG